MSSGQFQPFCLGLNVLNRRQTTNDHKFGTVLFNEFENICFPDYEKHSIISSIIPMNAKNVYIYFYFLQATLKYG